jgi:hypothetical protein
LHNDVRRCVLEAWKPANEAIRAAEGSVAAEIEKTAQVALLRHIIGDPFAGAEPNAGFPLDVVQCARSLYDGSIASQSLQGMLKSGGYANLAAHFEETEHPKGCWALDLLLSKVRHSCNLGAETSAMTRTLFLGRFGNN